MLREGNVFQVLTNNEEGAKINFPFVNLVASLKQV